MKLIFEPQGWADYLYWQASDPKMMRRLNALIQDTTRSPSRGIGKPEPLGQNLTGLWSRRFDQEHRFTYRVAGKGEEQRIEVAQCRFHYKR